MIARYKIKSQLDNQYRRLMRGIAGRSVRRVRTAKGQTQKDMIGLGIERRCFHQHRVRGKAKRRPH